MEEVIWGDDQHKWVKSGHLHTRGPGTYKIPSFNDTPLDLRVTLLDTSSNRRAVHSSKGIGEPPFFLGCSAFFAIRNAIKAARQELGSSGHHFQLNLPATSERIRMSCPDEFAVKSVRSDKTSGSNNSSSNNTINKPSGDNTDPTAAAKVFSYQAKGSW